jgi:hypothetical protein
MYEYVVMGVWDVFNSAGEKIGVDSFDYESYTYLEDAIRALRTRIKEEMDSEFPKIIGIRLE